MPTRSLSPQCSTNEGSLETFFFFKKQLDKFYYACKITERNDQPSFWWVESIVPTVFDCAPSTIAEISLADRSTDVSTSHRSGITP